MLHYTGVTCSTFNIYTIISHTTYVILYILYTVHTYASRLYIYKVIIRWHSCVCVCGVSALTVYNDVTVKLSSSSSPTTGRQQCDCNIYVYNILAYNVRFREWRWWWVLNGRVIKPTKSHSWSRRTILQSIVQTSRYYSIAATENLSRKHIVLWYCCIMLYCVQMRTRFGYTSPQDPRVRVCVCVPGNGKLLYFLQINIITIIMIIIKIIFTKKNQISTIFDTLWRILLLI